MNSSLPLTILCASLLPLQAASSSLARKLDRLLASASPAVQRGFLGIQVLRLRDGRVLYSHNDDHTFVPASNTKLFTTAMALVRLGGDYRFHTRLLAEAAPDASGRLHGDLTLLGGGDPSLSARTYPYLKDAPDRDPLWAIERLADQVAQRGITRIAGDIVGDDTRYRWEPYPDAWSIDDPVWDYGAPVSALTWNDNDWALHLQAGASAGLPVKIWSVPPLEPFLIENELVTGQRGASDLHFERLPGSNLLRAWGTLAADEERTELLALSDPAQFAAALLRDALGRRGITVDGNAIARHTHALKGDPDPSGTEWARLTSPPLLQILQVVDKVSQNLHAELLLREAGKAKQGDGSRAGGLAELKIFLSEAGVQPGDFEFADGSGLSRTTLITPRAVVSLLRYMWGRPERTSWQTLLPIAGVDGTLSHRFAGHPEAAAIQAKTGTLRHVRGFSGYALSHTQGELAFSVLVNNSLATSAETVALLDKIGLILLEDR